MKHDQLIQRGIDTSELNLLLKWYDEAEQRVPYFDENHTITTEATVSIYDLYGPAPQSSQLSPRQIRLHNYRTQVRQRYVELYLILLCD